MALVVEYHEELEIDLLGQGVDLLDFWRGTLTPRRLDLLVKHLPPGSATLQAMDPDIARVAAWGPTNEQLADLYDVTVVAGRLTAKGGGALPPYPRPADALHAKRMEQARYAALEAQRERARARLAADMDLR